MISRINKLLAAILLISAALYIVVLNSSSATIYLGRNWQVSATAGVLFLGLFGLGVIVTAVVASVFGMRAYFRERRLKLSDQNRRSLYEQLIKGRSWAAGGEWEKARHSFEQLLRREPRDILARIELARALSALGEQNEALHVLEEARKTDPNNAEVLFRAAELHHLLGNKTAALDNLSLILNSAQNRRAAALARDLSEDLGRFDQALALQQSIEEISPPSEELRSIRARIELRQITQAAQNTPEQRLHELRTFCRRYPDFIPGLQHLAALEAEQQHVEEAAQALVKGAKASKSSALWNSVSRFWLERGVPERALAAARSATKETVGEARLIAELELARIYISLHMFDEARLALDGFPALLGKVATTGLDDIQSSYLALRGFYLSQRGMHQEAAEIWRQLAGVEASSSRSTPGAPLRATLTNDKAPEARLSTP
ncbi:MAG: tetratricopeptide repeat protein [Oligoflexia bacterium]|nr:tetratricopeptide repeat protein [Oligoflexia bacterium]